jgi:hypothetical protein
VQSIATVWAFIQGDFAIVEIRLEKQQNPVANEVSALTAVVRPFLEGTPRALKQDVVHEVEGYENVKL